MRLHLNKSAKCDVCKTPKFPWQVPDNRRDMGATPLHLVRTVVAQRYRNAGRQEGQKEEQNAIVSGWIGWIHSPEKAKKETQRRIKREGARWEGPAVTFHLRRLSHSSARGDPALIKTGINKAACCRGGAGGADQKFISGGMLSWQFSLMSQSDGMGEGEGRALTCEKRAKTSEMKVSEG